MTVNTEATTVYVSGTTTVYEFKVLPEFIAALIHDEYGDMSDEHAENLGMFDADVYDRYGPPIDRGMPTWEDGGNPEYSVCAISGATAICNTLRFVVNT